MSSAVAELGAPPRVRARPTLITPWARYVLVALVAVAIGVTAWLGVLAHRTSWAGPWDLRMTYRLTHWLPGHRAALRHVADLGGPSVMTLVTAALAIGLGVTRRWAALALCIVSPLLAVLLTEKVLKPWVHRAPFGVDTYPSGHSTSIFVVVTVGAILLLGPTGARLPWTARWTLAIAGYAIAVAVAIALVAAGYHFATDTIGGAAVGVGTTALVALTIDAISGRRSRTHV